MLRSIFKKLVTVHEYNQGGISLAFAPQMRPHTKHIYIKYRPFWSFVAYGDVEIQYIDTKEHISYFYKDIRSRVVLIYMIQA